MDPDFLKFIRESREQWRLMCALWALEGTAREVYFSGIETLAGEIRQAKLSTEARTWLLGPVARELDRVLEERRASLEEGLRRLVARGGRIVAGGDRLRFGPITLVVDRQRGEASASYGPYPIGSPESDPDQLVHAAVSELHIARIPGTIDDLAKTLHGAYESACLQRRLRGLPEPEIVPVAEFGTELRIALLRARLDGDSGRGLDSPPWPAYALPWNLAGYLARGHSRARTLAFRPPGEDGPGAVSVTVVSLSGRSSRRIAHVVRARAGG